MSTFVAFGAYAEGLNAWQGTYPFVLASAAFSEESG